MTYLSHDYSSKRLAQAARKLKRTAVPLHMGGQFVRWQPGYQLRIHSYRPEGERQPAIRSVRLVVTTTQGLDFVETL